MIRIDDFRPVAAWRRPLGAWLLVALAILLLYRDTGLAMVSIWNRSETFAHAFLVPPIALWLAWRQRALLAELRPRPAPWMLLPMAAIGLAWLLGELVAVNALSQFALVALLVLSVPAVLGLPVARVLLFPLGFAFFAVPIGEFMLPTLIQWTADFTIAALRLSGIPVYREGTRFVIPSGSWSVVEACSGIRYLIASFMVGSLFAYLNYRSALRRWIFVAVSLLLPILANWIRAYLIVMLGHLSDNRLATGADHLVYGWVFFGIVITALFMIGARWAEPDLPHVPRPATGAAPARPAAPGGWWAAALALAIAVAPVAARQQLVGTPGADPAVPLALPGQAAGGWQATDDAAVWTPAFQNPSASAYRSYRADRGQGVGVHLLYYGRQDTDRKLVSSANALVAAEGGPWNLMSAGAAQGPVAAGLPLRAARLLAAESGSRAEREDLQVWQLYWINGRWTASDAQAKLLGAWDRLRGRPEASAAVLLFASEHQPGGARPALDAFLQANRTVLEEALAAARDAGTRR